MNSGVYQILNTTNGKFYIGSSIDLKNRLRKHFIKLQKGVHENSYLQRAFKKNNGEGFKFLALVICKKEHVLMYEQLLIDGFNAVDRNIGYNICPIAGSTFGRIFTDEAIANMRAKRNRPYLTEEHKKNISLSLIGNKRRVGIKHTEQRKMEISNFFKGRKFSLETIKKMCEGRARTRALKNAYTVT